MPRKTLEQRRAARAVSLEYRSFSIAPEVEERGDGGLPKLRGHAAVFNSLSEPMFGFREQIAPGAFAESIGKDDVRALWNHDTGHVLGRKSAGTLILTEDERGLAVDIKPPPTTWARDLLISIQRGDVTQMSFGFRVLTDSWAKRDGEEIRTLEKVQLFEVSPVTFPAYSATDISTNSAEPESDPVMIGDIEARAVVAAFNKWRSGSASDDDVRLIRSAIRVLESAAGPTPLETLDLMRRRQQIAALDL